MATPSRYTGQGFNELQSVTCISATDCWGVGADSLGGEALHWDRHRWSVAALPSNTGPLSGGTLHVVRELLGRRIGQGNEALHWDWHTWSRVVTPSPGTMSELNSIRCTSAANCWAVGGYGEGESTGAKRCTGTGANDPRRSRPDPAAPSMTRAA